MDERLISWATEVTWKGKVLIWAAAIAGFGISHALADVRAKSRAAALEDKLNNKQPTSRCRRLWADARYFARALVWWAVVFPAVAPAGLFLLFLVVMARPCAPSGVFSLAALPVSRGFSVMCRFFGYFRYMLVGESWPPAPHVCLPEVTETEEEELVWWDDSLHEVYIEAEEEEELMWDDSRPLTYHVDHAAPDISADDSSSMEDEFGPWEFEPPLDS